MGELLGANTMPKKYTIDTKFIFKGTFTVEAETVEEARDLIERDCGLVLGGDIHTSLDDDVINWDFNTHAETETEDYPEEYYD